jgi:hypothetical protein
LPQLRAKGTTRQLIVDGAPFLILGGGADSRIVLLWFGAWKNSMSSYAPAWVKRD